MKKCDVIRDYFTGVCPPDMLATKYNTTKQRVLEIINSLILREYIAKEDRIPNEWETIKERLDAST